ncbi:MAG: hypothetical protein JNK43_08665 [Ignavibacteria bacterium]|nr:hypothetical protein [Ignavibacteria bacterium]
MNRKLPSAVLIAVLVAVTAYGCSGDSVTYIVSSFDPPRFNWRRVEIPGGGIAGIWAKDTSKIFWINNERRGIMSIQSDAVEIRYYGNYDANMIYGKSESEIYVFGSYRISGELTIMKWNGNSFEYYPAGVASYSRTTIKGCLDINGNVWIASESGAARFDGTNITAYSFDNPGLDLKDIYYSTENKVEIICAKGFSNELFRQCLYEFRDSQFVKVFDESSVPVPEYTSLIEIGGYKSGVTNNFNTGIVCIEKFILPVFSGDYCFDRSVRNAAISRNSGPVGTGAGNYIFAAEVNSNEIFFPPYLTGIMHWNGTRLSAELGITLGPPGNEYDEYVVTNIMDDAYIVMEPFSESNPGNAVLYIGTIKSIP